MKKLNLGIDASNIVTGGGLVHLQNLLCNVIRDEDSINMIVVWCARSLRVELPDYHWIKYAHHPWLEKGKFGRLLWQIFVSKRVANSERCDLLFIPGGIYFGFFRPYVCMVQNMQIFELKELNREKWFSKEWVRLHLLRWMQLLTAFQSSGTIFPSDYAMDYVVARHQFFYRKNLCVVSHGIESYYEALQPFTGVNLVANIVCVSTVKKYKHQWNLIDAVSKLYEDGIDARLDIFGGGDDGAIELMNQHIAKSTNNKIYYHGEISRKELFNWYKKADIFVFPSTCESFGISVIEAMAFGLPILCSSYGPLPKICKDAAIYFDPLDSDKIAEAIKFITQNNSIMQINRSRAFEYSKNYSWRYCVKATCKFFHKI